MSLDTAWNILRRIHSLVIRSVPVAATQVVVVLGVVLRNKIDPVMLGRSIDERTIRFEHGSAPIVNDVGCSDLGCEFEIVVFGQDL